MASSANAANKAGAPPKKSIFERQREEAEAKRARDKAETAAVYEDFVKSFDHDEDTPAAGHRATHNVAPTGHAPVPGRRHFTSSGLKSGPGSLGPAPGGGPRSGPGSLGPNTGGYGTKRPFDDFSGRRDRDRERDRDRDRGRGMFSYDEDQAQGHRTSDAFDHQDEDPKDIEDLKAAAKPTLHLSYLPPGTSPAVIKALFTPSPLVVENVRILPAGSMADRKAISAIVTLAAETPAADIDTMVSHLQNKYLGFGFNLSISRHLSSAALGGVGNLSLPGTTSDLPFGAKPILQQNSFSRAPPPGQMSNRFAPPPSHAPYGHRAQSQVTVQPPSNLKQLKLIHKTLEALLTYGPEFEALLMSRPEIQRDESWAWLWNSKSAGGVYYRWRLWEILTNARGRRRPQAAGIKPVGDILFEGQSQWLAPEDGLKFEYVTRLDEFISDDDYNSSDEEGDEEGGIARRYNDHNAGGALGHENLESNDGQGYLNPLVKTKLVHLLSRLPETNAKLRKGDVARITGFAIEHAGSGADEVAAIITQNVVQPFCHRHASQENESSDEKRVDGVLDASPASLVGLYVISDILSCSASAGVRHAWRYRAMFENALRQQKIFEKLGRIEKDLAWGKLKAEKWRRSVQILLSLWEGWCVFPQAAQDEFVNNFLNPPLSEAEKQQQAEAEEREKAEEASRRLKNNNSSSNWKSVDENANSKTAAESWRDMSMSGDVDGQAMVDDDDDDAMNDVDGSAMDDDDVLIDENIDGVPMEDSSDEEMTTLPTTAKANISVPESSKDSVTDAPAPKIELAGSAKRQRPKAVDMFADDSE